MRTLPPGAFVVLVLFTLFCVPPASAHVSGEPVKGMEGPPEVNDVGPLFESEPDQGFPPFVRGEKVEADPPLFQV